MKVRSHSFFFQSFSASVLFALIVFVTVRVVGQNQVPALTLLSKEGRRTMPLAVVNNQEFVALDDLATTFQLAVREEAGAITVSYRGRTIVLTPDQALASVSGRLISLPAAPLRAGNRWTVPVDFISRALAPIYDQRLDLRRQSHLLIVGDVRVPRVAVRYEPLANAGRLTINATPRAGSAVAQDGNRLVIRFDADALEATIPPIQPQGFIQAIRTTDAVTLTVDLGPRFSAARTSTETIEDTTRLIIDLVGAEPATSGPTAPAAPEPAPGVPPATAPPPDLAALSTPRPAIRTIAIDPGHGGEDEGVKSASGTTEKDVTLAVARRLKAALEGRLGVRVLLTRDEDRNVPIDERSAIANNSKVDLFISLHANASLRSGAGGASIQVVNFSEADRARATLKPEPVPVFGGSTRDIEVVQWDLAQIRYVDQSTALAQVLESALRGHVPLDQRPIDSAPFRVLESVNMPAVLVEMGYLTNETQARQLAGAEFQNALVQAMVDGITSFRDHLEQNPKAER